MTSFSVSFPKPCGWLACCILTTSLLLFGQCKPDKGAPASDAPGELSDLPADFLAFFDKFHADTAYQLAHINFPLEGLPATLEFDTVPDLQRFFWQRADWRFHRPFADPSGEFENWFEMKDDRIIEHWIKMKGTAMHMYRRFAKLDDEWVLIYYQDMRPTVRR
jgi:hypothetical protein